MSLSNPPVDRHRLYQAASVFFVGLLLIAASKLFVVASVSNALFVLSLMLLWVGFMVFITQMFNSLNMANMRLRQRNATGIFLVGSIIQLLPLPHYATALASLLNVGAIVYLIYPVYTAGYMQKASPVTDPPAPTRPKASRFLYVLLRNLALALVVLLAASSAVVLYAKVNHAATQAELEQLNP